MSWDHDAERGCGLIALALMIVAWVLIVLAVIGLIDVIGRIQSALG